MVAQNQVYGLYCTCEVCGEKSPGLIRYVGQTSVGVRMRFYHHTYMARTNADYPVSRWIRKHGEGNICHLVLDSVEDQKELEEREEWWIEELGTMISESGLNLWPGGKTAVGYKWSEERRKARTGIPRSPETIAKLKEAARGRHGATSMNKKLSVEDVTTIKKRLWNGESALAVSRDYPVGKNSILWIAQNRGWTDVPWPIGPKRPAPTGKFSPETSTGENSHMAKLTERDVKDIRQRYTGRRGEYGEIARDYGVTTANISMIVRRQTWKHVP